jgi:hypothetical protein
VRARAAEFDGLLPLPLGVPVLVVVVVLVQPVATVTAMLTVRTARRSAFNVLASTHSKVGG